jgi:ABC-type glycerol-3-phosphate transport system permease component
MAVAIEQKKPAAGVTSRAGYPCPGLFGTRPTDKLRLVLASALALMSLGPLLYMVIAVVPVEQHIQGKHVLFPTHPTTSNYVHRLEREQLWPLLLQQPLHRFCHRRHYGRIGFAGRLCLRSL